MRKDEVGANVRYSTFKAVGIETADKWYTHTHTHTHTYTQNADEPSMFI